jgi:pyruvate/2-oxoglutarate dehydrogenase complex dihydrolipoamide acyltransferase (E2) component
MARVAITVPDLGMRSEEIRFGMWLKQAGDTVQAGEDLFEVEADKATVVCEAPADGVLVECGVIAGLVELGDVLGYIDA